MERFFPGTYELVEPGAERGHRAWWPGEADGADRPVRIAYCATRSEGPAGGCCGRCAGSRSTGAGRRRSGCPSAASCGSRGACASACTRSSPGETTVEQLFAAADIVCAASGGPLPAPWVVRAALAAGAVPVVSHIGVYEELIADGERGLSFPAGDAITLAGQLERLIASAALRRELRAKARGAVPEWDAVADQVEGIYEGVAARRHDPRANPEVRRRIARRRSIHVDLHMHTDHSPDCATPVEMLLSTAAERGLGAIAITDHNEISGALAAREIAADYGVKVIVAEEVKTAEQGEVIGLFVDEQIERGMTMAETIAEIRRQGGLVYVPHPFDRLHSVPDYEHLLEIVEEIDILEVFNPRVALTAFNEEAERFAAKYRIVPGAGSDSHVAQGLGSVMIRVHDFDGPEEFLEAMRDADIVRKHKNLIYVQALKFLQTSGGRGGAGKP